MPKCHMIVDPNVWRADFGLWRVYKPNDRYILRWDTEGESYYLYWTDPSANEGYRLHSIGITKYACRLQEMVDSHIRYRAREDWLDKACKG